MDEPEISMQRSGGTEAERRQDGAGRQDSLPGSEAARGNEEPEVVDAPQSPKLKRPVAGADGPVEVEEQSGAAFAETARNAADPA